MTSKLLGEIDLRILENHIEWDFQVFLRFYEKFPLSKQGNILPIIAAVLVLLIL